MLGFMKRIQPKIDGLTGTETNPLSLTDANAGVVQVSDQAPYIDPADPGHSFQDITLQIFGSQTETTANPPPMNGFAAQAETEKEGLSKTVMGGFSPDDVPIFKTLVQEFAVVDRWFASVPSSTQPNRQYLHSATSHGLMSNNQQLLLAGLPQKTIFESVEECGLSFGIYYQQVPNTLFYRNLRKLKYVDNFRPYDLTFRDHAKKGTLPNYTVIEPRYFDLPGFPANDDHPVHDVAQGQALIKEVYEALRGSPQWNEILFLITYDEHGGFYDHVPTPIGVPSPDGLVGSASPYSFDFTRLGVRVPTLLISPWIQAGAVLHKPKGPKPTSEFEHSSIPATVKKLFNLPGSFLTKRDEWAGTFETVLTRKTPRTDCPVKLPAPPTTLRTRSAPMNNISALSEFQEELVWLSCSITGKAEVPEYTTIADAAEFVTSAVATFVDAAAAAKAAGVDPDRIFKP